MGILRTRMDVNNLFALLLVNAVFELSTSFLFDRIPDNLDCFGHMCHSNHSGHGVSGGSGGSGRGKKRDVVWTYCEIEKKDGGLQGNCGEDEHVDHVCPQDNSKCRCYNQRCITGVSERYEQQKQLYRMTYACLNKNCHGTEYCQIKKEDDDNIVSSCINHLPHSGICVNHDSITSHGCYCNTADCVQNTALHCLGVTCNPSQGCEIYRQNGQIAAQCYSLGHSHCGDVHNCTHHCHGPLDHQHLPCHCDSQACADRIDQLDPYSCLAANCDKHEPFCQLVEANNNVEGRCMVIEVGQLCSPANDLSVDGGCYCADSKCVSNAITDYNQKHTTAATLAPGYMCNKDICRSDAYCHIVNYQGVATSRCLVFNALPSCSSYTDVEGEGCICDNTICSINILKEFSLHNQETTTTTSTTTQSTTPNTAVTTPTTTTTTTISTTTPTTTPTTTKTPITTPTTTTPTTTIHTTTPTTTPTTTTPTTTTPTTTTLTTTTPTTTPTTITSSTTTTVTATTVQAVVNSGPRTCHICGDTSLPVPCSSRQIGRDLSHTCKTGENYCMTDIVQDDQGNVDVFKRCVDLATCEKKWITESADLDYCKRYGVVKNPYAFSCHFCCTEDKCNSMLVPNTTTWYTKTN